jgi:hypothetical protein
VECRRLSPSGVRVLEPIECVGGIEHLLDGDGRLDSAGPLGAVGEKSPPAAGRLPR